jgi:hypothetical protein
MVPSVFKLAWIYKRSKLLIRKLGYVLVFLLESWDIDF